MRNTGITSSVDCGAEAQHTNVNRQVVSSVLKGGHIPFPLQLLRLKLVLTSNHARSKKDMNINISYIKDEVRGQVSGITRPKS